jgi:hypothetical protein
MEYTILKDRSAHNLIKSVQEHIKEGWKPVGSHHVITTNTEVRYHGQQTHFENQYSQTMIKE